MIYEVFCYDQYKNVHTVHYQLKYHFCVFTIGTAIVIMTTAIGT